MMDGELLVLARRVEAQGTDLVAEPPPAARAAHWRAKHPAGALRYIRWNGWSAKWRAVTVLRYDEDRALMRVRRRCDGHELLVQASMLKSRP